MALVGVLALLGGGQGQATGTSLAEPVQELLVTERSAELSRQRVRARARRRRGDRRRRAVPRVVRDEGQARVPTLEPWEPSHPRRGPPTG